MKKPPLPGGFLLSRHYNYSRLPRNAAISAIKHVITGCATVPWQIVWHFRAGKA